MGVGNLKLKCEITPLKVPTENLIKCELISFKMLQIEYIETSTFVLGEGHLIVKFIRQGQDI